MKDSLINKYSDFCRRILNKSLLEPSKGSSYYYIVEQLEKIGDIYRDLCKFVIDEKIKINKDTLEIYKEVNEYFKNFYSLFYAFDLNSVEEFLGRKSEIELMIKSETYRRGKDAMILFYLKNIVDFLYNMNGALMVVNL